MADLSPFVVNTALPNRALLIGARYARLPAQLQHQMTLAFGVDRLGELINPVTFPWARLNNHKVTLSFRPATEADEQTLASLLPEGPITDPSQLPSSIPSYLILVIPEIALDGQVVAQGHSMRLGEDMTLVFNAQHIGQGPDHFTNFLVGCAGNRNINATRPSLIQMRACLRCP